MSEYTKFTEGKFTYNTGAISNDLWTTPESGGVAGHLNLPRDLSLMNYRGFSSTSKKGVPYIFRTRFTVFQQNLAGKQVAFDDDDSGSTSEETADEAPVDSDFCTTLRIVGCQNNWVMLNAAVEWHQSRERMFRDAGVKKSDRGAYSHTIRYAFDNYNDSWIIPVDADNAGFNTGTWDLSDMSYEGDSSFALKLVGAGDDEESDSFSGNDLQIGHSYLMWKATIPTDTNPQTSETPAKFSVLRAFKQATAAHGGYMDDVREEARDAQDNPPYEIVDVSDSGDVNHNITEPVELGRAVAGMGSAIGQVIVDIPFGLATLQIRHSGANDQNIIDPVIFQAEVLDIFEMQG